MSESGPCTFIINLTSQDGDEGSPSNPAKFNEHDYALLKEKCRFGGKLFLDSTFPPENQSLGDLPSLACWEEAQVQWLRPKELLQALGKDDEPVFCTNGASRCDVIQGAQVLEVWKVGRLPTVNGQLLSVHSKVHMMYNLSETSTFGHSEELGRSVQSATRCKSMVWCETTPKEDRLVKSVVHTGLVDAHTYSVTGAFEVNSNGSKVKLVQLFNPWGRQEWNGNWSDKSRKWKTVDIEDQGKNLDREDGEFWMEWQDFCFYFESLFICCENPNFIDLDLTSQWKCNVYEGSWRAGTTAGGNINFYTFVKNPQYRIGVLELDNWKKGEKNILISLMQKPNLATRKRNQLYPIGMTLYKLPLREEPACKGLQDYSFKRDLIECHSLEPGQYVVIPSTMQPYMSADFVLTVYCKAEAKISIYDESDDDDNDDVRVLVKPPKRDVEKVTKVEKEKVETLKKDPVRAMFDTYSYETKMNPNQLQSLLNDQFSKGSSKTFPLDAYRSMMASVDTGRRIMMTFSEFSVLWKKIEKYQNLFHRSDSNQTGLLNEAELRKALELYRIDASDHMTSALMLRYGRFSSSMGVEGFIGLMIRLEKVLELFKTSTAEGFLSFSEVNLPHSDYLFLWKDSNGILIEENEEMIKLPAI